ncbi:MAG: terminase family protein, partial [Pseudomonadota bacterium]
MLLPYQEAWRADKSQIKLGEKSRQIGWTWTDALTSMEACASNLWDVWVSSRDELQAKLYLDDSAFWATRYQQAADVLGLQDIANDNGEKASAFVLAFPTGRRINSLSSNPDAQAGKRGARKLDEFALHKDPKRLYDIAYPGITWGGTLDIFSTHRGASNYFNTLIREIVENGNPKNISHHKVTLEDALDQGLLYKLQQRLPDGDPRMLMDEQVYFDHVKAGATDESAFLQEYMCVPEDEASAFITQDMLDACSYKKEDNLVEHTEEIYDDIRHRKGSLRTLLPHGITLEGLSKWLAAKDCYVGIDFGRHADLTVITVYEKVAGIDCCVAQIELQRAPYYKQEAIYDPIIGVCRRTCLDETGLGSKPVEDVQRRHGEYKAEGVTFSNAVKQDLAYPMRASFEDRSTKIPFDRATHADFRKIRKETTAAGNSRFAAASDEGGHADRFWSHALAKHAGKVPTSNLECIII